MKSVSKAPVAAPEKSLSKAPTTAAPEMKSLSKAPTPTAAPEMKSLSRSVANNNNNPAVGKAQAPQSPGNVPPKSPPSLLHGTVHVDINSIIDRLMGIGKPNTGISTCISEQDIMDLLLASKELFLEQPMMLELNTPISIVGDIHGQFNDLMRMFVKVGFPNTTNYLFLGDYIDRGRMNLETILLLLAFKIKYPNNFFLLRGNHETQLVNRIYGFYEELNRRYRSSRLYSTFQDVFNCMPLSALVGERILCMHGGLSPDLYRGDSLKILKDLVRPLPDPPNPSLPLDLLWADPHFETDEFKFSIRGVSCTFGVKVVNAVCQKYNLDLICRAHQVVQDGYEFFAQRKLVTIFSAPHYCGQFDNAAAVMMVSKDLQCSFRVLRPKYPNAKVKCSDAQITTYQKLA